MIRRHIILFSGLLLLAPAAFFGGFKIVQKIHIHQILKNEKVVIEIINQLPDIQPLKEQVTERAEDNIVIADPISETLEDGDDKKLETKNNQNTGTTQVAKLTFAVIGDTQRLDPNNIQGGLQQAVREISKQNVDLVFALGDLISSCDGSNKCREKLTAWRKIMGSLADKTYVVQGNHDRVGKDRADRIWSDFFNMPTNGPEGFKEFAYSIDFSNSHFVVLASDKPKEFIINATQRKWLDQDLAKNKKENIFVFFHEPAYPVSNKLGEGLDTNPKERNELWNILLRHKVTAVFNGHEHIHSRKNARGIYQFAFGNTDSFDHDLPRSGMAEYAYRGKNFGLVEVDGKKITVKTYTVDGKLLDSFKLFE